MRPIHILISFTLMIGFSYRVQAQEDNEASDEEITALEQQVTEAEAELEKAREEFLAAQARMGEAERNLNEARGAQPSSVAMAMATMDKQIAESAGILADYNTMERRNNLFGTGGIGVGAHSFAGGVIGSSYGNHYGGQEIMLGALDKSVIDRVIKQHLSGIRECYQEQKVENPELAGKVVVKLVIGKDGTVSSAKVEESSLDNVLVENCVCNRFEQMQFPSPKGGGLVIISYPIVFH